MSPRHAGRPLLGVAGGVLGTFGALLSLAVNYVVLLAAAFGRSSTATVALVVIGELATTVAFAVSVVRHRDSPPSLGSCLGWSVGLLLLILWLVYAAIAL
jgi:hypothetical protein